jgi:hypothetical protein
MPFSKLSATIVAFSAAVQLRRRPANKARSRTMSRSRNAIELPIAAVFLPAHVRDADTVTVPQGEPFCAEAQVTKRLAPSSAGPPFPISAHQPDAKMAERRLGNLMRVPAARSLNLDCVR